MDLTDILNSNRRMSFGEIAQKAKISRTTLFKIRQSPGKTQVDTLRAVCKAMGYKLTLSLEKINNEGPTNE